MRCSICHKSKILVQFQMNSNKLFCLLRSIPLKSVIIVTVRFLLSDTHSDSSSHLLKVRNKPAYVRIS